MVLFGPSWLPPMDQWYSGLIPYPVLLPIQLVLIGFMSWINYEVSQGRGPFRPYSRNIGTWLTRFSYVYFGGMALRYGLTMWTFPERRWFGEGTIPIVFHFVLAGYVFTLARFYRTVLAETPPPRTEEGNVESHIG